MGHRFVSVFPLCLHVPLLLAAASSVPNGVTPSGIAASSRSGLVYVLDSAGVVWSIDGSNPKSVPSNLFDSAGEFTGTLSFVAGSANDKLAAGCGRRICVLDCATRTVERMESPFAGKVGGLAYQPKSDRLFVSEPAAGRLWTMSLKDHSSAKWLDTSVYSQFGAIALDGSDNSVFVSDPGRGAIYFADTDTKPQHFATLADDKRNLGLLSDPSSIVVDPNGEWLYVADAKRHALFRIFLKARAAKIAAGWESFRSAEQPPLKGIFTGAAALAMDARGRLWVADKRSGAVLIIDPHVPSSTRLVDRVVQINSLRR